MTTNDPVFAGVDFTSGRQPVMLAVLDDSLNIILLEKYDVDHIVAHLEQYERISLVLNVPSTPRLLGIYSGFKEKIGQAGFKLYSTKNIQKQLIETNAQDCFRMLIGRKPLPRRTLEGRVQRGLILYQQGLHITDPMDFFEELTSHHILAGVFPNELLHSASELDALVAAYVAWLAINEPGQTRMTGNKLVIPEEHERD